MSLPVFRIVPSNQIMMSLTQTHQQQKEEASLLYVQFTLCVLFNFKYCSHHNHAFKSIVDFTGKKRNNQKQFIKESYVPSCSS
jgi:hypothetical protein